MTGFYGPFALKLHAFGLRRLHDPNWTGMELYDHVKQHIRGRQQPTELLREPLERGLPYMLGHWLFDEFISEHYFEDLDGENQAWFLDDLASLLRAHGVSKSVIEVRSASDLVRRIDSKLEKGDEKYYGYLESDRGKQALRDAFDGLLTRLGDILAEIREQYAENFSDRVFHDRELCGYLAELMLTIGFDGIDRPDGVPCQWVERIRWPARVKRMLISRDRGKCARCRCDLVSELTDEVHIDHIVPVAVGGCNDLVNLQLLCMSCNLKKGAKKRRVRSSVPNYIRRAPRR